MKPPAVAEIGMFHFLTGMHCEDSHDPWLLRLIEHLDALLERARTNPKFHEKLDISVESVCTQIGTEYEKGSPKERVLTNALACVSFDPSASESNIVAWIKSLLSASVSSACEELTSLSNIPAFVTSDILLRTPMSNDELYLQLDIWTTFIDSIGQAYHTRTSHTSNIIHNLAYYSVQVDPHSLPRLISNSIDYFTSSKSGFTHKLMSVLFSNNLIYSLAYYYIQNSTHSAAAAMAIIKAQEDLVKNIGHSNLSQEGYIGVVLAISHVSAQKAARLFEICQTHFPEPSTYSYVAHIYLSSSPEQLLHYFNNGIAQFPNSASLWLVFVKRLRDLELLSSSRAQKLIAELVSRKDSLIMSKDIILTLLQPIESVSGIEMVIKTLEDSGIFPVFKNVVLSKYLSILYRYSKEKNVHKPYLDKHISSNANIECARYLYHSSARKTCSIIGTMLNGEVAHQPEEIYNLYIEELQGKSADESCLLALLRASQKRENGQVIMWGQLYAPQVAVHEFKKNVAKNVPSMLALDCGIFPSNRLWRTYIQVLTSSQYVAELADVMQWWEKLQFVPTKNTLMMLLNALPHEFAERHIKHALSLPTSSGARLEWPWPTIEDFQRGREVAPT